MKRLLLAASLLLIFAATFFYAYSHFMANRCPEVWNVSGRYHEKPNESDANYCFIIDTEIDWPETIGYNNRVGFIYIWLEDQEMFESSMGWSYRNIDILNPNSDIPNDAENYNIAGRPAHCSGFDQPEKTDLWGVSSLLPGRYKARIYLSTNCTSEQWLVKRHARLARYEGIRIRITDRWRGKTWNKFRYTTGLNKWL